MEADRISYPLKIDGLRPSTISMSRLAEYLAAFAGLLGSVEHVRFESHEEGSLVLKASATPEAACAINPRIRSAARGDGPSDAVRGYRQINKLLTEDETAGSLPLPSGEIIAFPGSPRAAEIITITQFSTVQGYLTRIEGKGDRVGIGLDDAAGIVGRIVVSEELSRDLGGYFHRYVRLSGEGKWRRDQRGKWALEFLHAHSYELLDETDLGDVLRRAGQHLPAEEAANAFRKIRELRDQ